MKKFMKLFMAITIVVLFVAAPVIAQTTDGGGLPIGDVSQYFLSPYGVVSLVLLLTGYVTTHWITADAVFLKVHIKQWVSYIIGMGVCFAGYYKGLGMFVGSHLINVFEYGIASGLVANGVYSLQFIQSVLTFIGAKKSTNITKK